jgi:hypothetical protein
VATRTGIPGTKSALDALAAAEVNDLPGGTIAYAVKTATETGASGNISSLSITYTMPGGRFYIFSCLLPRLDQQTSNGLIKVFLKEGGTTVGLFMEDTVTASQSTSCSGQILYAPSAGSHTYTASISTSAGTVDVQAASAPSEPGPAQLVITDVGPSF